MQVSKIRTSFASALKQWRSQRGLSQEELAERANLHRTYISDIERGARNVSLESINKLAGALEVSLPRLFSPPTAEAESATVSPQPTPFVDILLVEDNPGDVELTLLAFTRARFANSIRVVRDGEEALELFFGQGGLADQIKDPQRQLVLLDLNLPKVDGMEVLRQLKADKRTRNVAVVILTISDDQREVAECRRLGAEAFITKPVSLTGLSKVTRELSLSWALINSTPGNLAPVTTGQAD